jgi:hypothetical protein
MPATCPEDRTELSRARHTTAQLIEEIDDAIGRFLTMLRRSDRKLRPKP